MIKKIKFFVRINEVPCHTLEDLQNNFYLQDVMSLYREGILRRWLISNDEGTLAEKIKQLHIDEDNNTELAKSLIDILCPHFSKDSLNDALNYFYFEKNNQILHCNCNKIETALLKVLQYTVTVFIVY